MLDNKEIGMTKTKTLSETNIALCYTNHMMILSELREIEEVGTEAKEAGRSTELAEAREEWKEARARLTELDEHMKAHGLS